MEVEIIVAEVDCADCDEDCSNDKDNIYLRKNLKLSQERDLYAEKIHLDICKEDCNGRTVIGELSGHFFNLSLLDKNNQSDKVVVLLQHYNQETFDICKNLVLETMPFQRKNKNICHLGRSDRDL